MGRGSGRLVLLRSWAIIAASLGFLVWLVGSQIARGSYVVPLFTLAVLGAIIGLAVVRRRRAWVLLREPRPEPIVEYTRRMLGRMQGPHMHLMASTSTATYHAYWGHFGRALTDLELHDFREAPDLYRAGRYRVQALVHLLSRDDVEAGLRDAEHALRLIDGPRVPGMSSVRAAAASLVDAARMLCSGVTPELAANLEQHRRRCANLGDRVVIDWSLGVAYTALGRSAELAQVKARLQAAAPHCKSLHDFSLERRAPTQVLADELAAQSACARHPERVAVATCIRCGNFACQECAHGARAAARVCADCHALHVAQRRAHLRIEQRIRGCGWALQLFGLGWIALALPALALSITTGEWLTALPSTFMPVAMTWLSLWQGKALRRLDPGGRNGLVLLALSMLMAFPFGWLFPGPLLVMRFGRQGRFVLSAEYLRVIESTPEIEAGSARGYTVALLVAAVASVLLMALSGFALL